MRSMRREIAVKIFSVTRDRNRESREWGTKREEAETSLVRLHTPSLSTPPISYRIFTSFLLSPPHTQTLFYPFPRYCQHRKSTFHATIHLFFFLLYKCVWEAVCIFNEQPVLVLVLPSVKLSVCPFLAVCVCMYVCVSGREGVYACDGCCEERGEEKRETVYWT